MQILHDVFPSSFFSCTGTGFLSCNIIKVGEATKIEKKLKKFISLFNKYIYAKK